MNCDEVEDNQENKYGCQLIQKGRNQNHMFGIQDK